MSKMTEVNTNHSVAVVVVVVVVVYIKFCSHCNCFQLARNLFIAFLTARMRSVVTLGKISLK